MARYQTKTRPFTLLLVILAAGAIPSSAATFDDDVKPFLAQHCQTCHGPQLKSADLSLEFADERAALADPYLWEKVRAKVAAGQMPPKGIPRPDPQQVQFLLEWIAGPVQQAAAAQRRDPGRVTVRRLNRSEYNNTVRNLLGVDFRPADDFPVDDTGYGFDNIGDVLTLSPILMEKYMAAASKIVRRVILTDTDRAVSPTVVRYSAPRSRDAQPEIGSSAELLYSPEGRFDWTHTFPATGDYEIDARYVDRRNIPPRRAEWMNRIPELIAKLEPLSADESGNLSLTAIGEALDLGRSDAYAMIRRIGARKTGEEYYIAKTKLLDGLEEQRQFVVDNPEPPPPPPPPPLPVVFKLGGEVLAEYSADKDDSTPGPGTIRMRIEAGDKRIQGEILNEQREPWNPNSLDWSQYRVATTVDADRMLFVDYVEIRGPYNAEPAPLPASHRAIMSCAPSAGSWDAECARRILAPLVRRAYRRPVSDSEVSKYVAFAKMPVDDGDSFEKGVQLALKALLVSPQFLFRVEQNLSGGDPRTAWQVSDHELASRLSYFLWSSMPDDALLDAAGRGDLRSPEGRQAQVRRMLADPKSHALTRNFAGQWLELRNLSIVRPDPEIFPQFDGELRQAMLRETESFFDYVMRDDRSILEFLDSDYTFLNDRLAEHYGIAGVDGPEFRKVALNDRTRGGVMSQAGILTVSSYPTRTSPVLRGLWILENLLGEPPPAPPANVPKLNEAVVGKATSLRGELERHRADPTCAVCHDKMDPLGFGLENYNAIGQWRSKDGDLPIDSSGELPGGARFDGPGELKQILMTRSSEFARTLTERMLTYALGRGLETYDRPAVDEITNRLADEDYRFSSMILGIVESMPFQMRRGEEGT